MEEQTLLLENGRKAYRHLGFALFLLIVCAVAAQLVVAIGIGVAEGLGFVVSEGGWVNWVLTFVPLYAVAIPVTLLVMKKVPVTPAEKTSLSSESFLLFLLMTFPLMYGGNILGTMLSSLFSGGEAENALLDYAFDTGPLKILVMVVLAPLLEELVFRKFLLDRTAVYGERTAVLFSALTFGLFHMNLFQFFYAFSVGWIFAVVYVRTRRLVYPVVMHMVINFMGSVLAPWVVSAVDMEVIDQLSAGTLSEAAMMEALPNLLVYGGYVLGLLFLSVTGLIVLIIQAKSLRLDRGELPKGQRIRMAYGHGWTIAFLLICAAMFVVSLFA